MALSNSDIAKELPIQCRQGNSFNRGISFYTNNVIDDISTSTFYGIVQDASGKKIIDFTMADGCTIVSNKLMLSKTAAQMLNVPGGYYTYAIEQTYTDNTTVTKLKGPFTVIGRTA